MRGLGFKDIKITNETVDGKPVLVIEGMIVGETRKPVELPRLRFSVRDAQGAEGRGRPAARLRRRGGRLDRAP